MLSADMMQTFGMLFCLYHFIKIVKKKGIVAINVVQKKIIDEHNQVTQAKNEK